jgi:hypothetical protein
MSLPLPPKSFSIRLSLIIPFDNIKPQILKKTSPKNYKHYIYRADEELKCLWLRATGYTRVRLYTFLPAR